MQKHPRKSPFSVRFWGFSSQVCHTLLKPVARALKISFFNNIKFQIKALVKLNTPTFVPYHFKWLIKLRNSLIKRVKWASQVLLKVPLKNYLFGLQSDCIWCFKVSLNPVRILKENAEEEKAEIARLSSFVGAIAIGDLVKSTLGPKGK